MLLRILLPFCSGLIIFLCGLALLRHGINKLAGSKLNEQLLRFTRTPLRSFLTGTIAAACLQSSSTITVLTIGFVNANIISFTNSIGIILGSNIGTTLTTQLIALNIKEIALPLLLIGIIMWLIPHRITTRLSYIIGGFGALFYGMNTISRTAELLKETGWIETLMQLTPLPILTGIILGGIVTAITQSSSATTAITMSFYATGVTDLPLSIALVFGGNIGTCITGLFASINTNLGAKKVAIANILLNVSGVLIFAPFIPIISQYAIYLSTNPERQIAHIQTLFNVVCSLTMLPFSDKFAWFVDRLYQRKNN